MALPNPPATAYDGYTYTERICQEYGQQPRYYQVRNPIPGSDWRNDGGWAIVLERGGATPAYYSWNFNVGVLGVGGTTNYATLPAVQYRHPVTVGGGRTAYPLAADDPFSVATAIIDHNGNGVIDAGDNTVRRIDTLLSRYYIIPQLAAFMSAGRIWRGAGRGVNWGRRRLSSGILWGVGANLRRYWRPLLSSFRRAPVPSPA